MPLRPLFAVALALLAAAPVQAEPNLVRVPPTIHLAWVPDTQALSVTFQGGCMSSSYRWTSDTLTATAAEGRIVLGGAFLVDNSPTVVLTDMGNCPSKTIVLPAIAPGARAISHDGDHLRDIDLGPGPLEVILHADPWLSVRDLRRYFRDGVNRFRSGGRVRDAEGYRRIFGEAIVTEVPGSPFTHVRPDPVLHWLPDYNDVSFSVYFGCLSSAYVTTGNNVSVAFDRSARVFDVAGAFRFLPGIPGKRTEPCQNAPVGGFRFREVEPGFYQIRVNGETVKTILLGDRAMSIHRSGFDYMK